MNVTATTAGKSSHVFSSNNSDFARRLEIKNAKTITDERKKKVGVRF